jgi:DNA-binding transcriptional ArsR family regulator
MNDPWSQSLAMLSSPTAPFVPWPSASCRRVSYGEADGPASTPGRRAPVQPGGLDATDLAVLELLRRRPEVGARALAQAHGLAPRTVARRLLHLNALGFVRATRDGLWTVVDLA